MVSIPEIEKRKNIIKEAHTSAIGGQEIAKTYKKLLKLIIELDKIFIGKTLKRTFKTISNNACNINLKN